MFTNEDARLLLDLAKLANECRIGLGEEESISQKAIDALSDEYVADDLIIIYGYFIQHETNAKILLHLIKSLDKIRYVASYDILLNIVQLQGRFKEMYANNDEFVNVRIFAIKALANLKDTRAVVPLLDCLNNKDENYKIRLTCADALGKIGDKYAVMPLINVVTDETEKSSYVRESAATALGMLGDMRAVDSLVSILETKKGLIDKFTFLKERVIEALGKFSFTNDRIIKALRNSLMDESPQIRINAIEALMNSDDDRAVDLIKQMLKDKDEEVVKNAVIALYNLCGADILHEILQSNKYSEYCKSEAEFILEEYESEEDYEI